MKTIKSAEIVAVGTELLLGQTVNTNASFLAMQLAEIGIFSYYQTVVGDNPERMRIQIELAAQRSDCVLITGGLGPTKDDISMAIAAEVAGKKLQPHEPSRRALENYFKSRGRTNVTDNNWKQTLMPEGGIVLSNNRGTAPGVILPCEVKGHKTVFVLLPGPPSELQPMFRESVRPYLEARADQKLRNQYIRMFGIGESAAESAIQDLIDSQTNPTIASYVAGGDVMFRVTQKITNEAEPDLNAPVIAKIKERLSDYIYEIGQRSMAEVLVDLLRAAGRTVSFAESCTGGLLAASITDIAGSSAVFKGGIVAYDNSVKMQLLNVSTQILESEGAVSAACAKAMATGCRDVLSTDYAVSVTGIAGPDGGSEQKPVGLVYLAIADEQGTEVLELRLFGDRARIREGAVRQAQNLLRRRLLA
jgi:nicotinamide-nucleotide amidase